MKFKDLLRRTDPGGGASDGGGEKLTAVSAMQEAQAAGLPQTGVAVAKTVENGGDGRAALNRAYLVRDRVAAFSSFLDGDYRTVADQLASHGFNAEQAAQFLDSVRPQEPAAVDTTLPSDACGTPHNVRPGADQARYGDPGFTAGAMSEALLHRIDPDTQPSEQARPFVGASIPDLLAHANQLAGVKAVSASPAAVVSAAIQSNSDFVSALVGDVANARVRDAYQPAESSIINLSRQLSANDFRAMHFAGVGEYPELQKVNESGEFSRGPVTSEGGELLKLETYGRIASMSRQALVNDQTGALEAAMSRAGTAANDFVAKTLANLLSSNPTFFDGVPIFDSTHGNVASTGTAITVAALSEARQAMRSQTDVSGNVVINIEPRILLVAPDRETEAQQIVADTQPNQADQANPFAGRLRVLVDPRLPSGAWYVAAAPSSNAALYHAFLDDAAGPVVESRAGFDVDGVEMKVRLDFGAGMGDFRPIFRNSGN